MYCLSREKMLLSLLEIVYSLDLGAKHAKVVRPEIKDKTSRALGKHHLVYVYFNNRHIHREPGGRWLIHQDFLVSAWTFLSRSHSSHCPLPNITSTEMQEVLVDIRALLPKEVMFVVCGRGILAHENDNSIK
jgi:hypothetical protein